MEVQSEAIAACRLFGLEPTAQRLERITGKASRAEGASNAPNWNSMRALRDDDGNVLIRHATSRIQDAGEDNGGAPRLLVRTSSTRRAVNSVSAMTSCLFPAPRTRTATAPLSASRPPTTAR